MKNENVNFYLIGQVNDISSRQWPENMRFIGSINDKDLLAEYYSATDVFLMCSKRETYSMTCAEALCCGTPVVGFESGAPETVFTSEFATFVPYGDVEKLREAILAMIGTCEMKREI